MSETKIEISRESLASLGEKLEALKEKYNENLNAEHPSLEVQLKLDDQFREVEADYLHVQKMLIFKDCEKSDKPMRSAILKHNFMTKRHKIELEGEKDNKIRVCRIVDAPRSLDLLEFDTYMAGNDHRASANKDWANMIAKLAYLMTVDTAKSLGVNPKSIYDCYAIEEIARKIELGETPTSNTQMLKTLQSIIDAIIYEENPETNANSYKASSHDVKYLKALFTKKGKKELSVACAKPAYMRYIVTDICYGHVADKLYSVEFIQKKKKDTNPADKSEETKPAPKRKSDIDNKAGKPAKKSEEKPTGEVAA